MTAPGNPDILPNEVPLYDPAGHQLVAAQAGTTVTDNSVSPPVVYAPSVVTVSNANANGPNTMVNSAPVTLASNQTGIGTVTSPNVNDTWLNQALRNGQAYSYGPTSSLGTLTNPSLTVCLISIFNPAASGKSILIYSLVPYMQGATAPGGLILRYTTVDPATTTGFTNIPVAVNMKLGGAASVSSLSTSANNIAASITPTGSIMTLPGYIADSMVDYLANGCGILLPAGSANGIEFTGVVASAGQTFGAWAKGIEF